MVTLKSNIYKKWYHIWTYLFKKCIFWLFYTNYDLNIKMTRNNCHWLAFRILPETKFLHSLLVLGSSHLVRPQVFAHQNWPKFCAQNPFFLIFSQLLGFHISIHSVPLVSTKANRKFTEFIQTLNYFIVLGMGNQDRDLYRGNEIW